MTIKFKSKCCEAKIVEEETEVLGLMNSVCTKCKQSCDRVGYYDE